MPASTPIVPPDSSLRNNPDGSVLLIGWRVFSESEKALLVGKRHAFRSQAHWLPKSQIRSRVDLPTDDGLQLVTITISPWIAKEKNFA